MSRRSTCLAVLAVLVGTSGPLRADDTPERHALAQRIGTFDVTETLWASPGAPPVTTTGLVADRRMVGEALQETLHVAGDVAPAAIKRMDLLYYSPVEGRWSYVSLETRIVVGLMPAWSFGRDAPDRIELTFLPFAILPPKPAAPGLMLQMREVFSRIDADHDVKDQYFVAADGTGVTWLGHRYAYARRPKP